METPSAGKPINILLAVRSRSSNLKEKRWSKSSAVRTFLNQQAIEKTLRSLSVRADDSGGVGRLSPKIVVVDLAKVSFKKQVALVHASSVFISMHGASSAHVIHQAVGSSRCCAFIELFPAKAPGATDFREIQGYQNFARHLGIHSFQQVADTSTSDGSYINLDTFKGLVRKALVAVESKPSCLIRNW